MELNHKLQYVAQIIKPGRIDAIDFNKRKIEKYGCNNKQLAVDAWGGKSAREGANIWSIHCCTD